jgi:hypothetical protein
MLNVRSLDPVVIRGGPAGDALADGGGAPTAYHSGVDV